MDEELNKLVSPESILIIDSKGVLRRLKCPFKVEYTLGDAVLVVGVIYMVQAVAIDEENIMVYFVRGKPYYYYLFLILL